MSLILNLRLFIKENVLESDKKKGILYVDVVNVMSLIYKNIKDNIDYFSQLLLG